MGRALGPLVQSPHAVVGDSVRVRVLLSSHNQLHCTAEILCLAAPSHGCVITVGREGSEVKGPDDTFVMNNPQNQSSASGGAVGQTPHCVCFWVQPFLIIFFSG